MNEGLCVVQYYSMYKVLGLFFSRDNKNQKDNKSNYWVDERNLKCQVREVFIDNFYNIFNNIWRKDWIGFQFMVSKI